MNALTDKVSFQLKLLPAQGYIVMITKATELLLVHIPACRIQRLPQPNKLVLQVFQQLTALSLPSRQIETPETPKCFKFGSSGHISRNYRARNTECFKCGGRGHIARQCWSQGNARGGFPVRRAGGTPNP